MTRSSFRHIATASLFLITSCAYSQEAASLPPNAAVRVASNDIASNDIASNDIASNEAVSTATLPDDPAYSSSAVAADPQTAPTSPAASHDHTDGQTKRILGIIPNFRAVSANQHLPPQSIKDKFVTATQDSFDYSSIMVPALLAGYDQALNKTPEFHQGGLGYSRYLWHSVLDQTSENYFVEFIVPAITHEDTRYYTLGSGGFKKRAFYAVKHVVVTRNDAGKDVFNSGEVVGAGLSAALSNAYYPSPERTVGNTFDQFGTSVGIDAFTFVFKEFWPDINHKLFHGSKPYVD